MINICFYRSRNNLFLNDLGVILHLRYHFITCVQRFASNTPHTQTIVLDVRWVTSRRCLNVPQNCLKVPQVCLKVPQNCLKVPPLFSAAATSSISQLQALPTALCSIQILILCRSTLSSCANMVSQGTPGGVSRCPSTGYIKTYF